ncbi:hypothetical protein SDC9_63358 [bioreactor metagenome]|uniref:Uncharacterized protein n=1 Tax=bioreactor metagenome TaxID=1076179 RepID=A0A644XLA4_9ZZZZ
MGQKVLYYYLTSSNKNYYASQSSNHEVQEEWTGLINAITLAHYDGSNLIVETF